MRKLLPWLVVAALALVVSVAFASGSNPSFSFSTDEPGATFTCKLDNGTTSSCSSPKNYTGLSTGTHHLTIVSTFTVPTVAAPTAAFTFSPSSPVTGSPVHFDGTASTCPAGPCSYRYADTTNNATLVSAQSGDFTFQNAGTKHVQLTVTDAQSRTASVSHDVVVSSTAPPPPTPPVNTAPPTISGTPQQGQTLTASPGTWTGSPTPTYTYHWSDGNVGVSDVLGASDVGQNVSVTVTATNSAGSATAASSSVGPVTASGATGSCDLNATPASFASQFSALQPGQTLCLASGSYGTWTPGSKSGRVTVQAAQGADVTIDVDFKNSANITLDGIDQLQYVTIEGASHDLTISHSTVTPGLVHLLVDQFNHANILIDHDTFPNTIATSGQGRVWTDFNSVNTTNTIGVTVSNSLFTGGDMIDILIEGGAGLQVLNNEFTGMDNTINEAIHSDTIFNFGDQGHNVMKGNWFHDQIDVPACGWAQWDGGDSNVFENNVISHAGARDGCYESMAVLADNGSVIQHNTIEAGTGEAGPIGQILVGHKCAEQTGTGAIIRDNVVASIDQGAACTSPFTADHNINSATYVGGASPNSFAGFALAAGSPGIGAASDGTNIGIELPTGG